MRAKKRRTSQAAKTFSPDERNAAFWNAAVLALLCALFWAGMSVVGLRASENQYIDSYALASAEASGETGWKISLFGWEAEGDFFYINQLAGWGQKLFPLIPAPIRLESSLQPWGSRPFLTSVKSRGRENLLKAFDIP